MTIRLLADYRGVLTGETFYVAGVYVTGEAMSEEHATALVAAGRAVVDDDGAAGSQPERAGRRKGAR